MKFFRLRLVATIPLLGLWGLTGGGSWRNDWPIKGRTPYPLLFDRNYEPKPAYQVILAE